jgi:hypothetical protein
MPMHALHSLSVTSDAAESRVHSGTTMTARQLELDAHAHAFTRNILVHSLTHLVHSTMCSQLQYSGSNNGARNEPVHAAPS